MIAAGDGDRGGVGGIVGGTGLLARGNSLFFVQKTFVSVVVVDD
jgi:hypothetical protein